jgi:hypothetical protein
LQIDLACESGAPLLHNLGGIAADSPEIEWSHPGIHISRKTRRALPNEHALTPTHRETLAVFLLGGWGGLMMLAAVTRLRRRRALKGVSPPIGIKCHVGSTFFALTPVCAALALMFAVDYFFPDFRLELYVLPHWVRSVWGVASLLLIPVILYLLNWVRRDAYQYCHQANWLRTLQREAAAAGSGGA